MIDYINNLIETGGMPWLVTLALGFISAISPCPMTTNISAIGYIAKNISDSKKIFLDGIFYAAGRVVTYTVLGAVAIFILRQGFNLDPVNNFLSEYGEMILPPILILMALITLNIIKIGHHHHKHEDNQIDSPSCDTCKQEKHFYSSSNIGAFVMGLVFALAFCPINGMFFFGMLSPVAAKSSFGYFMPLIYGLITGLPVIIVSWIIAYSVKKIASFNNKIVIIERWGRIIISLILIAAALYFSYEAYFLPECSCGEIHNH